jgi:hypothetical protein
VVKYGENEIQPVVFDPPLTQAEAEAYWEALNDTAGTEEGEDAGMVTRRSVYRYLSDGIALACDELWDDDDGRRHVCDLDVDHEGAHVCMCGVSA